MMPTSFHDRERLSEIFIERCYYKENSRKRWRKPTRQDHKNREEEDKLELGA